MEDKISQEEEVGKSWEEDSTRPKCDQITWEGGVSCVGRP